MTYLKENSRFLGTGEKNAAGASLQEFLESYDPRKYDNPCNTVDIAVFRKPVRAGEAPGLLMIRRKNHPNIGYWALPGGFVEIRENLETAAARELEEETGVTGMPLVQLGTWGDYDRDPRWRVITTLYGALIDRPVREKAGDDAADAAWFDVYLDEAPDKDGSIYLSLRLECREKGICLRQESVCAWEGTGELGQWRYTAGPSQLLAGDHGLMITDAVRKVFGQGK